MFDFQKYLFGKGMRNLYMNIHTQIYIQGIISVVECAPHRVRKSHKAKCA